MSLHEVNDNTFSQTITNDSLTLVDFGAPWCPPCKALLPTLEALDQELGPSLSILKVNCDESPKTASEFGIMSMPTVILFRNGIPVEKLVGLRPKDVYKNVIAKHMQ